MCIHLVLCKVAPYNFSDRAKKKYYRSGNDHNSKNLPMNFIIAVIIITLTIIVVIITTIIILQMTRHKKVTVCDFFPLIVTLPTLLCKIGSPLKKSF